MNGRRGPRFRYLSNSNPGYHRFTGAAVLLFAAAVAGWWCPVPVLGQPAWTGSSLLLVQLEERNESGVSGQAWIVKTDGETQVRVSIIGPEQQYLPYLHRGTCDGFAENGSIPFSLVSPSQPSETTVDVPLETLASGEYVIDLHIATGNFEMLMDPATSVACGRIGDDGTLPLNGGTGVPATPVAGIGPIDPDNAWAMPAAGILLAGGITATIAGVRAFRRPATSNPVVIDVVAMHRLRGLTR